MMIWSKKGAAHGPVTVTAPDRAALIADLEHRLATGQGFTVATLNLDHVVKLGTDPAFHAAYAQHSHVTADGRPIVWLSHLSGQQDVGLVPGSELVAPVAARAAAIGARIALFGATEASLTAAADALRSAYPEIRIVLTLAPPMGFDPDSPEAEDAIETIAESGAQLVFLALGAPKQERFAARAAQRLPQVGFLSIGAGLDFLSGAQVRAPAWIRGLAMEWLWRLLSNPQRLARRYGLCLVALPGLVGRAFTTRREGAR